MSGEGPGGTGRFPQQKRPLKEGGSWGKHGFPHGSEVEFADSVAGQSPATRPNRGASDFHAARSQYWGMRPRSATIFRSASIAVYVGSTVSSPRGGVSASPRSSARSSFGTTSIESVGIPAYLQRRASSAARSP